MTYRGAALRHFDAPQPSLKPVPFEEAIGFAEKRGVVLPEIYYGELQGFARDRAFSVAGLTSVDQVQGVLDSLNEAIRGGLPFGEWQKKVRAGEVGLDFPRHRLETIFRTNLQVVYSQGRIEQQERAKDRYPYFMYDAVNDSRTRLNHRALDGYIAPAGDPFWKTHTPPLGYNCRCVRISLTRQQAISRGYGRQDTPPVEADPGWGYDRTVRSDEPIKEAVRKRKEKAPAPIAAAIDDVTTRKPGPQGPKVRDALVLPPKGAEPFRHVLGVIEALHGDGKLPRTTAHASQKRSAYGWYTHYNPTPYGQTKPSEIHYSVPLAEAKLGHPELTLAHEIGHWLDREGAGVGGRFESEAGGFFTDWLAAVERSEAVQHIRQRARTGYSRKYANYLLRVRELWARSYAQWVAVRSGDAKLVEQLELIRRKGASAEQRLSQWEDADFEAIAREIDALFRKIGWMG